MKDLFEGLVKIGNNNPELRDDIAPLLHHIKEASYSIPRSYYVLFDGDNAYSLIRKLFRDGILDDSNSPLDLANPGKKEKHYIGIFQNHHSDIWKDFEFTLDEVVNPTNYDEVDGTYTKEVRRGPNVDYRGEDWSVEYPREMTANFYVNLVPDKANIVKSIEKHLIGGDGWLEDEINGPLPEVDVRRLTDIYGDPGTLYNDYSVDFSLERDTLTLSDLTDLLDSNERGVTMDFHDASETKGDINFWFYDPSLEDFERDAFTDAEDLRFSKGKAGFVEPVTVTAEIETEKPT